MKTHFHRSNNYGRNPGKSLGRPRNGILAAALACSVLLLAGNPHGNAASTPGAVGLLTPTNGEVAATLRPTLTWSQPSPPADWYHLWLNRNGVKHADFWVQTNLQWTPTSDLPSGNYFWWIQGWNQTGLGLWSGGSSFSVPAQTPGLVTLLTPTGGQKLATARPTFAWSQAAPAATWYHFLLQRNGKTHLDRWIGGATNWTPTTDLPGGNYAWWVQPWNSYGLGQWSSEGDCSYLVPGRLTPISPVAETATNYNVLYTWTADEMAEWYELYVQCNDKLFADKWFSSSESVVNLPDFGVNLDGHRGGTYKWWVRGWSRDGLGPWSEAGSFTKEACPPGAVSPVTPINGEQITSSTVRYQWTVDPCATYYRLYINRNGTRFFDQWYGLNDPAVTLSDGNMAVNVNSHCTAGYQWWVQSWGPDGSGGWSTGRSFSTAIGPCLDIEGYYSVIERGQLTMTIQGQTMTTNFSGSATTTVNQNGCNFSFSSAGMFSATRYGTISCDQLTLTGQTILNTDPNIIVTKNILSGTGSVTQTGPVIRANVYVEGSYYGYAFTMSGVSTATFQKMY